VCHHPYHHPYHHTPVSCPNSAAPFQALLSENLKNKGLTQVAGFFPRDQRWAEVLEGGSADIPLLLIHGESDKLVPLERSLDLEAALKLGNRKVKRVSHPGAHMMPSCSQGIKVELQHFLDSVALLDGTQDALL
jgi:predicted esterase